jgi:hypothetical protein
MRTMWLVPMLLTACGLMAVPVGAHAFGDFAPRGSLFYARAGDLSGALNTLGGEDWQPKILELLRITGELEDMGGVDEAMRFIDYLGQTEVVIVDLMLREPHVQLIEVSRLKDGAPTEFSKDFIGILDGHDGFEVTPTSIRQGPMLTFLEQGLFITVIGGAAETHVRDVLDGFKDESLSGLRRFEEWSKSARGDVVAWANMRAWRNVTDRFGEEFSDSDRMIMEFIEWNKWDTLTVSLTLPRGGDLQLQAELTFHEPLSNLSTFLRPAGANRLASMLPRDTLMFASAQLGTDHERTLHDILGFIHDAEMRSTPKTLEHEVRWANSRLSRARQRLDRIKEDQDLTDAERTAAIEDQEVVVEHLEQALRNLEERLANFTPRPFAPHGQERGGTQTDAEEVDDFIEEFLVDYLGVTRLEAARALGSEALVGVLNLPAGDDRYSFEYMTNGWFVMIETSAGFDELKDKILEQLLPEDDDLQAFVRYSVPGGEILSERRITPDVVFFAGSGVVGMAPSDYVARRVLAAAGGGDRLYLGSVGAASGSKAGWIDLAALIDREVQNAIRRSMIWGWPPSPSFDIRDLFPAGAVAGANTNESANAITLTATLSGPRDAQPMLKVWRDEVIAEAASFHDRNELSELVTALRRWGGQNGEALDELDSRKYRELVASVTPESLVEQGLYKPRDGLRSAFDPVHVERFVERLDGWRTLIGGDDTLEESSHEWYGLMPTKRVPYFRDGEEWQDPWLQGWIVAATKGPWVRGGRYVVRQWPFDVGGGFDEQDVPIGVSVMWLPESEFQALFAANRRGEVRVFESERPAPDVPEWQVRYELGDEISAVREIRNALERRRREQGENFRPTFRNGTLEELRLLLDNEWEYAVPHKLTIETTDEGIRVRYTTGNLWIESGPEGEIASWQTE